MKKNARGSNHGDVRIDSVHMYHGETALAASGLRCSRTAGRNGPWGTSAMGSHKTGVDPTKNIQNAQPDIRGARVTNPERTPRSATVVDKACKGRPETKADSGHDPQRQNQLAKMISCVCRKNVDVLVKARRCVRHDRQVMQPKLDARLDLRQPPKLCRWRWATRRGRRGR